MSRTKILLAATAAVIFGAGGYMACDAQTDDPTDRTGKLAIEVQSIEFPLRDNPSQQPTSLIVEFSDTSVHHRTEGWIDLEAGGMFDLLHPDPNPQWILGATRLPDGTYDEIRFEVRVALVQVDRKWYEVEVPSGEQSGLKIHTTFCLVDGDAENLGIEFDVGESLHWSKQRGYWLTPSMNVFSPPSCTDDLATPPSDGPTRRKNG